MTKKQSDTMEEEIKTGYEGTGKEDPLGKTGGDDLPAGAAKKEEPEKKQAPESKQEPAKKEEPVVEQSPEDAIDEFLFLNDKDPDEEEKEVKPGEEKKEEKKEEESQEIFDLSKLEQDLEQEKSQKAEAVKYDWKALAKKELDVDLEDNSQDKFISAVKNKISDASQKTVVDTSKYSEDARTIINFLEDGGNLSEILLPVAVIDKYLTNSNKRDLVKDFFITHDKMTEDQANEEMDTLEEDDKFEDKAKEVLKFITESRTRIINKTIQASQEKINQRKKEIADNIIKERSDMITEAKGLKTFLGTELKEDVKQYLVKEIESGKLTEQNNNAKTQVLARLLTLFGDRIIESYSKQLKNVSRESFNTGKQKELEKTHNILPTQKGASAEEQRSTELDDPLAAFRGIDKDSIEVP